MCIILITKLGFNEKNNISKLDLPISKIRRILSLIKAFNKFKKNFKNYRSVIKNSKKNNFPLIALLHDNTKLTVRNITELQLLTYGYRDYLITDDSVIFKPKGLSTLTLHGFGDLPAIFFEDEYSFLPVSNKIVIDLGSHTGDSLLYFAMKNAKKVIGFESEILYYNYTKKIF